MSRYLTEGLPSPVILAEDDYEKLRELRLYDYVERGRALGMAIDTEKVESSPHVAVPESAAAGDLHFVRRLNYAARVALLSQDAEGPDLNLHLQEEGLTRLPGESDEAARERLRINRKGKSAAGPDEYYIARARNTSVKVVDVAVRAVTENSSERVLVLYVLTSDNGGQLTDELRDQLTETLNDPTFRSRNVTVRVEPAVILTKDVTGTIYIYPNAVVPTDDEEVLRAAFARDQKLGFDLTESYVAKQEHRDGVQKVVLNGWTDAIAGPNQAIALGAVTFNRVRLTS